MYAYNNVKRTRYIYICSPFAGDTEENVRKARLYARSVLAETQDAIPVAPHLYFPQFTDDNDPKERQEDIDMGLTLLSKCSEIWVYGIDKPSDGMKIEIQYARMYGIKIVAKERLASVPKPETPPVIDPVRVKYWTETYRELNKTCPEMYSRSQLRKKLNEFRAGRDKQKTGEDRNEIYASIDALEILLKDGNLT